MWFYLVCALILLVPCHGCSGQCSTVYHQSHTISKYLHQQGLPEMNELTACFWLNIDEANDRKNEYIVSVARPGSDNEFIIGFDSSGPVLMFVRGAPTQIPLCCGATLDALWTGWHKHCFTFKAGGSYKWYADKRGDGKLELVGSAGAAAAGVRSGGNLVLMQEQDSVGGGFDLDQTISGQISDFNMWNREMSGEEISSQTCGSAGNVVSWSALLEQGKSARSYQNLGSCNDRVLPVYHQETTTAKYLKQASLPEMTALTTCFWLKISKTSTRRDDYLVSVASTATDNEFIIGLNPAGNLEIHMQAHATTLPLCCNHDINVLFNGWHKHCFTYKAGGSYKWYVDATRTGEMELVATAKSSKPKVRAGGHLVLLQEQDSVNGGFNLNQMTPGEIAEFNMWDHEMSVEELNSDTCGSVGSVASWNTLQETGSAVKSHRKFVGCKGRSMCN